MDVSRSVVVGTAIGVVLSVYFIKKLYRTTRTNRTSEDHLSRHKRTARRPEGEETEVEVIKVAGQVSGVALSSSRRNRPHHLDSDRRSLLFVCSLYCAADDDLLAQDIKNYPSILGNIVITDVAKSDPVSCSYMMQGDTLCRVSSRNFILGRGGGGSSWIMWPICRQGEGAGGGCAPSCAECEVKKY